MAATIIPIKSSHEGETAAAFDENDDPFADVPL